MWKLQTQIDTPTQSSAKVNICSTALLIEGVFTTNDARKEYIIGKNRDQRSKGRKIRKNAKNFAENLAIVPIALIGVWRLSRPLLSKNVNFSANRWVCLEHRWGKSVQFEQHILTLSIDKNCWEYEGQERYESIYKYWFIINYIDR